MRWALSLPLISLLVSIAAALALMSPLLEAMPYLVADADVQWIASAPDLRPRRPVEGERIQTLRTPDAVVGGQARQYSFMFDRPAPNSGPLGVLVPVTGRETRVFINAYGIDTKEIERRSSARIAEIPALGLQQDPNRVEVIVPDAAPYNWPRAMLFGPLATLQKAGLRHAALQYWTMIGIAGFGLASCVLGFLPAFFWRERLPYAFPSLVALMMSGFAALALYDWPTGELFLQPWLRNALAAAASLLLLLMIASEVSPWPRSIRIAFRFSVAGLAVSGAALLLSFWNRETALSISHWAVTGTVLLSAGATLPLALAGGAVRATWSPVQRSIAALLAFALLMAALSEIGWLSGIAYLTLKPIAGVAASLGVVAWFAWIFYRVFRDIESELQKRLGLGRIIREQQAQLAAQKEALEREIVQRTVLEERERLSRDIHDGVGGSLVSLLVQARTGSLNEQDLEAGLQRTLSELRLMIDALDHSQATLAAAFSTFQTRITPAFAAAGIALDWRQDDLESRALKDPLSLLNVFRILQEACTNVIRHAHATSVTVKIAWNQETNVLEVDVEDDGTAGKTSDAAGHGLKNMTQRATRIGAILTAGPIEQGQGWRVRLHVPGR